LNSASVSNETASHGQAVNIDADAPGGSTRVGRLDAWCARGTRIPSRHRGRRDLSTRRAQATAAVALSIQRGVFSVARQPDRVPVGHGHVDSSDAPSGRHRHAGVAGRLDFRCAAGELADCPAVFSIAGGDLVRRRARRFGTDDSSCRYESVSRRPIPYLTLGVVAPLALLTWFDRIGRERQLGPMAWLCRGLIILQLMFSALALAIAVPGRFEQLSELQPMRSLHLLYALMFLFIGGLIGESLL